MHVIPKLLLLGIFILLLSSFFGDKNEDTLGEIKTLPYEKGGNINSPVAVVFLHGFPSTLRLWDKLISNLEPEYFYINISYPNFVKDVRKNWGLDLMEIVNLIKSTLEHIETENGRTYKKMFVAHDWGAIYTYLFDYTFPGYIQDIVAMDVGGSLENTLKAKLITVTYQLYLASSFLIGGSVGKFATQLFINYYSKPYGLTPEDLERADSSWNYVYFYFWKNLFFYKNILENLKFSCPVVYIYGTNKTYMFHSERFISELKHCDKCEVHSVNEGHWVMNNNFKFVFDVIRKRISLLK